MNIRTNDSKIKGMTLIEVLIVVSLVSMVSLSIYKGLSTGLRVWERSNRQVIEEDIAIFFDKIGNDLRNANTFSLIKLKGDRNGLMFPTIVRVKTDKYSGLHEDEYVEQLGLVEYYYDRNEDSIFKRVGNYSQAVSERFGPPQRLLSSIRDVHFRYVYLTEEEEKLSDELFEMLPASVEIELTFEDSQGVRTLQKIIDIPVGT